MGQFELTVDNDRLLARLKKASKVPDAAQHLRGFNLWQTVDEDGVPAISTLLGPINSGRRGRKPSAIPLSSDPKLQPRIGRDDRLHYADVNYTDVEESIGTLQFVVPCKQDVALRIFRTGLLLSSTGGAMQDIADIAAEGKKIRYHGIFPLTADAASVVGEGLDVDITAQSRVIADERLGRINGVIGVPKVRETLVEVVLGGPVLVGQINGDLKIVELTRDGWKTYDVTGDAGWQRRFLDMAAHDAEYLAEIEAADKAAKRRQKVLRVIKAPIDHADG